MMLDRIAKSVIRTPWLYIFFYLGVTVFAAAQLPRAEIDPDTKSQLPSDLPSRLNLNRIEELFGATDMVMLVVSADDVLEAETLKRIKYLSEKFAKVTELDRVISLFTMKSIRGEDDLMIASPAVGRIPKTTAAREALRRELRDNELILGSILSQDCRHTAIIGFLDFEARDEDVHAKLKSIIAQTPGPGDVLIGGMPLTRLQLSRDIRGDMRRFLPFGLLLMLVFLFLCFRQLRGVILPFAMTAMSIIVAMGLLALLGWRIHVVTVIMPVILIAVANDYSIHLIARYQEENRAGWNRSSKDLARSGILEIGKPTLAAGITTIAGLLCLLTHIIIPARQLGVLAAAGVLFAVTGSLLFVPAVMSLLPRGKPILAEPREKKTKLSLFEASLSRTADLVAKRPRTILVVLLAIAGMISTGIPAVQIDANPNNFYDEDKPVRRATDLLNEHFGGWAAVSVVVEGDVKDPQIMRQIDEIETHLGGHPHVGGTSSIARIVKNMNEVMHSGDSSYYNIPPSKELIAQYFLLYSMSGDAEDFEKLVDFPYRHAQIAARINKGSSSAARDVIRHIRAYRDEHPDAPIRHIGGLVDILADLVDYIARGQITSLLLSMLIIGVLVALLMRSVAAGLMAMIPLALAMLVLFGIMGYLNIELNIPTAMLSSIMIGVGVDYTIHYLWRYRDELRKGRDRKDAIRITLTTTGRGIVFNALSVIVGFAVLMISSFFPVRFFGLLVVVSIGACLIGALVLLPVLSLVFKPRFLEGKNE